MNICRTCDAFVVGGARCKNGFVPHSYAGAPTCQKEDAPYHMMPPYQWKALTFGRVVANGAALLAPIAVERK
jgi:hypothetical protein